MSIHHSLNAFRQPVSGTFPSNMLDAIKKSIDSTALGAASGVETMPTDPGDDFELTEDVEDDFNEIEEDIDKQDNLLPDNAPIPETFGSLLHNMMENPSVCLDVQDKGICVNQQSDIDSEIIGQL